MKKITASGIDEYLSPAFQDRISMAFLNSVSNYLDKHESEIADKYKQILLRANRSQTPEQLDKTASEFLDNLLVKLIESIDLDKMGFEGMVNRAVRGDGDIKLDREVDKIMQQSNIVPIRASVLQIAARVASKLYL
jgi:hypothetical protein